MIQARTMFSVLYPHLFVHVFSEKIIILGPVLCSSTVLLKIGIVKKDNERFDGERNVA